METNRDYRRHHGYPYAHVPVVGVFGETVTVPLAAVGLLACLGAAYRLGRENRAALLRMAAVAGFFHSFFIYVIYLDKLDVTGAVLWASLLPLSVVSLVLGLPSRQPGDGEEPRPGFAAWFILQELLLIFPAVDIIRRWIRVIVPSRRR